MPHGHSAIDSLIALTALRKYQAGGAVVHESLPMTKEYSTDYPVGDKFVYKGVSSVLCPVYR